MTEKQYGMVVDLRRCAGCHACTVSCKSEHDVPLGYFRTKVAEIESGTFPKVKRDFIPMLCYQCTDAPCVSACPTHSIQRDENGIVYILEDTCVSAGPCVSACPYDAIYLNPQTGLADKCDFCRDRLAEDQEPSCVSSCPTDAFIFGDLSDPTSTVSQFLKEHNTVRIKEDEGTAPNVLYYQLDKSIDNKLDGINTRNKKG